MKVRGVAHSLCYAEEGELCTLTSAVAASTVTKVVL